MSAAAKWMLVVLAALGLLSGGSAAVAGDGHGAGAAGVADPAVWGIYASLAGTEWNGSESDVTWRWGPDDTLIEARPFQMKSVIRPGANRGDLVSTYGGGLHTYDGRIAADGSVVWVRRGRFLKLISRVMLVDGMFVEEMVKLDDAGQVVKVNSTQRFEQTGGPQIAARAAPVPTPVAQPVAAVVIAEAPAPATTAPPAAMPAADDLDRKCAAKDAESCSRIGYYHVLGAHGRSEDAARAVPYLQQACEMAPPTGCSGLADVLRRGKGVPVDAPRALALHVKACELGDASGCYGQLGMQSDQLAPVADPARNARLVEQVCRADQGSWMCVDARKLVAKIALPLPVYEARQCDAGEAYVCLAMGNAHATGRDGAVDPASAAVAYGKACDLGLAIACNALGEYVARGSGVAQDFVRAVRLFEQSCNEKSVDGCANLGAMYFNGTGVPQDYGRAAALNNQACAGGNTRGCDYMERATVAIMGTPEQQRAENAAQERENKARGAEALQRAVAVHMGDLANHFEREARTQADADAMLDGIRARANEAETVPSTMDAHRIAGSPGADSVESRDAPGSPAPPVPVPGATPASSASSCPFTPRRQSGTSGFHETREAAEAQARDYVRCGEGGVATLDAPVCSQHMQSIVTMTGGRTSTVSTPRWNCSVTATCTIGTPTCADDNRERGSSSQ
ncbi:tetratricopeptide repeat protein [Luteimonas sp. MC1828]|uniref:tetratricopeptide repeat protein n=1 Tax=Luteimonas sp. MC1828 TaxID=2799787 RepID=UPI0018F26DFB|nr:tetratricopeptide repeat protein [Luteimonas sp. MC1828]MBJ7573839.1 sel1 repeat family protein [Luteimonas sp. MC1828]